MKRRAEGGKYEQRFYWLWINHFEMKTKKTHMQSFSSWFALLIKSNYSRNKITAFFTQGNIAPEDFLNQILFYD